MKEMRMPRAERGLVLLLQLQGGMLLLALAAVFLPFTWMAAVHAWLRIGKLPQAPIVEYLARSLSGMYAFWGPVYLFLAADIRRYLPMVRFLARLQIVCGVGMLALDAVVGMPLPWTVSEGPIIVALALAVLLLARRLPSDWEKRMC
jgi:hypothetical protein